MNDFLNDTYYVNKWDCKSLNRLVTTPEVYKAKKCYIYKFHMVADRPYTLAIIHNLIKKLPTNFTNR